MKLKRILENDLETILGNNATIDIQKGHDAINKKNSKFSEIATKGNNFTMLFGTGESHD